MIDLTKNPLVESDWLAAHLNEPTLRIVDSRCFGAGDCREPYLIGHIPGAIRLCWHADLSYTKEHTRYLLLPPGQFARVMAKNGIGNETRVVAYAESDYSGAARLWWALRYYGHDQVAVLNGGLTRWLAEQRPLSREAVRPASAHFTAQPQPNLLATAAEIETILADPNRDAGLVDTRPPEQYAGQAVWTPAGSLYLPPDQDWVEVEGRAIRGGHIPGAISRHAVLNLDPANDWRYRDRQTLRRQAEAAGLKPEQRVITYCGCGISASLGLFALHLAGYQDLALYDASWEEWGTNPNRPVERLDRLDLAGPGQD
jgi:thiosulfate/3-mercaptopyruvate sulfurtransferase